MNGEKIFVIFGEWVDVVVVWVILNCNLGWVVIKFFVVEKGMLGMIVMCLEKKFGIKVLDIVLISFNDCWVLVVNLLGNVEVDV